MACAAVREPKASRSNRGFTIIGVIITTLLVSILAGIALPSYQKHVRSAARAGAEALMQENAIYMERYFTTNGTYVGATLPNTVSPKTGASRYTLSFSAGPTDTLYTLQAVPDTRQTPDPCKTLTLTNTGVKGASGWTAAACW